MPIRRHITWTEPLRVGGDIRDPLVISRSVLYGLTVPMDADLEMHREDIEKALRTYVRKYKEAMNTMVEQLERLSDRTFEKVGTTTGPSINAGYAVIRTMEEYLDVARTERIADDLVIRDLTQQNRALTDTCADWRKKHWDSQLDLKETLQRQLAEAKIIGKQDAIIRAMRSEAAERNQRIRELEQQLAAKSVECASLRGIQSANQKAVQDQDEAKEADLGLQEFASLVMSDEVGEDLMTTQLATDPDENTTRSVE